MTGSNTLARLLALLSDGEWHSGEELGAALQISRAAVSKQVKHLTDLGIELEIVKGVGYRAERFELLDEGLILEGISPRSKAMLSLLELHHSIPSTNQRLLTLLQKGESIHGQVCLAETQTLGRGRRGRPWFSPFAKNVYLSVGWNFRGGVAEIEGLSLAVGVVVCEVLESLGFDAARLKWPNDILLGNRKLGGVLIELGGDAISDCVVVLGVGLNVAMRKVNDSVDQPWTSLYEQCQFLSRNLLAAKLTSALLDMLVDYPEAGFAAYRDRWNQRSAHTGQAICLTAVGSQTFGDMLGVGKQGELLLNVDGGVKSFIGGELSLRVNS